MRKENLELVTYCFFFFFLPCCMTCWILVPQPEIEPKPWQ